MKKNYIFVTIIIGLVGLAIISNPVNAENILVLDTTIEDFSGFSVVNDTSLITSQLNTNNISMVYNNELGSTEWETLFHGFGSRDNIFDFNFSVSLFYDYNASAMGEFVIGLGSYYFYNGTYGDLDHDDDRLLCSARLWDDWNALDGKYSLRASPWGSLDGHDTDFGTMPKNGSLVIKMSRNNYVLNMTIFSGSSIEHTYQWATGPNWPLSYFYIGLKVNPTYCDYTSVFLSSINCSVYIEEELAPSYTPTDSTAINCGIVCVISVVSINAIFVLRRKRKV